MFSDQSGLYTNVNLKYQYLVLFCFVLFCFVLFCFIDVLRCFGPKTSVSALMAPLPQRDRGLLCRRRP